MFQINKSYVQTNYGSLDEVFPLLCPVREKDWLGGWDAKIIYSQSGLIEENCVFTTIDKKGVETTWFVSHYSREHYTIEFVRLTPGEMIVKINIFLKEDRDGSTSAHISYLYTALNKKAENYLKKLADKDFEDMMVWWEKAINYYLKTGELLKADK